MKKAILSLFFLLAISLTYGQKKSAWSLVDISKKGIYEQTRRPNLPSEFSVFKFDYENFVSQLVNVPKRDDFYGVSNTIVSIPMPNGDIIDYRIVEASSFDEILQSRFPNIRSFAGNDVRNPSNVIRFSISEEMGISAWIRSTTDQTTYIVDPYSMDYSEVIVFDRSKATGNKNPFSCSTLDETKHFGPVIDAEPSTNMSNADDGILRRFDLAQSCTAEYANAFGATSAAQVNLVLAAYNATLTRVNGIYEQDFNVTLQIINQSTNVIYYNPATDPYSDGATGSQGAWNLELQNNLNANLTGTGTSLAANNAVYDIGHLFGASGGGGNAGCIGCVCVSPTANNQAQKGSGFTSPSGGLPQGDTFDIDYVAHEYGHQFGGNHTFTTSTEDNAVNVEPGSGVTIMGYAGITGGNTDVASNSIAIFHAATIHQVTANVKTKTCDTETITGNSVPFVSVTATKTLPIGTAFKLVGTATDANASDMLSYCWEQTDNANGTAFLCGQSSISPGDSDCIPLANDTDGPNFRSFLPKNNGIRNFPNLSDHLTNGVNGNKWEVIPNVTRVMNFRLTVRDNRSGAGNNESARTVVTFDSTYGPFLVTSQNTTGINYTQGSTQTITWSVNNTTALAGSANVNIKLSTDGGQTFSTTLVANTPNDGSQTVTIPNVSAPFCRILIEPTGNDYYAINTQDFAIGYTVNDVCNTYTRTLTTGNTITAQAPLAYQNFSLNIPDNVLITDVNVSSNITHSRRNQLYTAINSPNGTFVQLFTDGGCGNAIANLTGTWDSQSANLAACGVTNNFGTMRPVGDLSVLNGENSQGNWFFRVADVTADTRDGVLNSFSFQICYKEIIETPNACGVITSTWNGSSWSNGVPLRNVQAIFNGNYTSTSNIEACSVIVNSGSNVTFAAGHTLIVTNEVIVNGTGVLTIENNAALRQTNNDAVNSGNIIVRRNSSPMVRLDYTAWSSPITGQNLKNFSPNTLNNRFYEYVYTGTTTPTAYQSVANVASTNFATGKGYMIRSANDWPTTATTFNGQFTGVPFNGNLDIALGKGYNLLGNPYASPMDADRFLFDNSTTIGAIYFWTHTVAASGGTYPVNNYSSYTTLGGTAAAAGGAIPNGKIQTGQGFFVRAFDFGNAIFSNEQRVNASTSTQFFRTSNEVSTTISAEKHRIWFNLNDANTSYNQMLLGYMQGATNGFDNLIDGKVLDDTKPTLFNIVNSDKYVIQGRSLPFTDTDVVPLGLKVLTPGTYSISIENVDGLFTSQDVFIKDKYNNSIHDVKQSPYSFSTQEGTFTDRFEVVYKNALTNDDFINENGITVYTNQNGIVISASENIKEITVFDVLGRKLYDNEKVNENEFIITKLIKTNQALLVKTTLTNGQTITKKVVF